MKLPAPFVRRLRVLKTKELEEVQKSRNGGDTNMPNNPKTGWGAGSEFEDMLDELDI